MTAKLIFVTGPARSGTSLLATLLQAHGAITLRSQPLPRLYSALKRESIVSHAPIDPVAEQFPLTDLFADRFHPPEAFSTFLHSHRIPPDWFAQHLRDMAGFSGQLFTPKRPPEQLVPQTPLGLGDLLGHYLARTAPDDAARDGWLGCKEIVAEEAVPYFLKQGVRVLLILRDPRDVVASAFSGAGPRYAGQGLPLLFVLRQWRKSVAFALRYRGATNLLMLRYEALVRDPAQSLDAVAAWLGLERFDPALADLPLRDSSGAPWVANSAHHRMDHVSANSIGAARTALPGPTVAAIETLCAPEMAALGYPRDAPPLTPQGLAQLTELCPAPRPVLSPYIWGPRALAPEHRRLTLLQEAQYDHSLHMYRDTFDALRAAMT